MAGRGPERAAAPPALPLRLLPTTGTSASLQDTLADAAFDASPDALAVLDRHGRLLRLNRAGRALLPAAAPGAPLADALLPQDRLVWAASLNQALAEQASSMECRAGENGPRLQLGLQLFASEGAHYVLVSGRDIEARMRLEQRLREAERQESLARLAAGLAHDFNNVLTVVIGNNELLAEHLAQDETGRVLADVSLAAARAGAELTRLLLASSGSPAQRLSEFCAADCVQDLRGLIERSLGTGIALRIATDADPWHVRADRAQLAHALLNLALNARDAMPEGGRLTIEVRNVAAHSQVMIAVSDTGSGIPADIVERVFEPFFTTKRSGSGLGLAMVRDFVRQAGGEVEIASRAGAGTTVRLTLPRAQTQLGLPHLDVEIRLPRARGDESVLVVERDAGVRGLLRDQLEALGYAVIDVGDEQQMPQVVAAAAALDLLVVGLDPASPEAARLARRLRRTHPRTQILYVCAESADSANPAGASRSAGAMLIRPFTRQALARRVRAILDGRI